MTRNIFFATNARMEAGRAYATITKHEGNEHTLVWMERFATIGQAEDVAEYTAFILHSQAIRTVHQNWAQA